MYPLEPRNAADFAAVYNTAHSYPLLLISIVMVVPLSLILKACGLPAAITFATAAMPLPAELFDVVCWIICTPVEAVSAAKSNRSNFVPSVHPMLHDEDWFAAEVMNPLFATRIVSVYGVPGAVAVTPLMFCVPPFEGAVS